MEKKEWTEVQEKERKDEGNLCMCSQMEGTPTVQSTLYLLGYLPGLASSDKLPKNEGNGECRRRARESNMGRNKEQGTRDRVASFQMFILNRGFPTGRYVSDSTSISRL